VRRPAWLARLTVTEQSERFDLDCRRELLHARTLAGTISSKQRACPRPLDRAKTTGRCAQASVPSVQEHDCDTRAAHTASPAALPTPYSYLTPMPKPNPAPQEISAPLSMSSPWRGLRYRFSGACHSPVTCLLSDDPMSLCSSCSSRLSGLDRTHTSVARLRLRWDASIVRARPFG
jgi:hypothetical protein